MLGLADFKQLTEELDDEMGTKVTLRGRASHSHRASHQGPLVQRLAIVGQHVAEALAAVLDLARKAGVDLSTFDRPKIWGKLPWQEPAAEPAAEPGARAGGKTPPEQQQQEPAPAAEEPAPAAEEQQEEPAPADLPEQELPDWGLPASDEEDEVPPDAQEAQQSVEQTMLDEGLQPEGRWP